MLFSHELTDDPVKNHIRQTITVVSFSHFSFTFSLMLAYHDVSMMLACLNKDGVKMCSANFTGR